MLVNDVVEISIQLSQVPQDGLGVAEKSAIIVFTNSIYRYYYISNTVTNSSNELDLLPNSLAIKRAS